ncbi:glycine--tRNA ligase subunit beta [Metabacillus fastidiosus]|uniref:Glycine--tRNA ligase beta subunit n=1 Tax=Metabacillus fastidiosus TaxID=1458 RepID=A0ABU6NUZ6_9BACI|nr:glycine--tRNA ligase subunit beta [Metabacillus fastidiosus]MED4400969.1 glycine--tRNA ligase subunit beta [Metabacillus fastidiosus]
MENKRDLLIELGLEEVPAQYVTNAMNQLTEKLSKWLESSKISFGAVKSYSTPRRLAVLVQDVAEKQENIEEEAKGPAKKIALNEDGSWSKAAIGFTKGQGASVEDIYFKEINGVEYVHVQKFIKGTETKELLKEVANIITGLTFPKNMRWGSEEMRFIRPIKWLIALFGDEIIPFEITKVQTGRTTYGHRFLGGKTEIASPLQYEEILKNEFVIVDPVKRKEDIRSQLRKLEQDNNWVIPVDEDLLEEVNNLVEYPTALFGSFEDEYLALPDEVLVTTMREHQRYFPVRNSEGQLQPNFVTVRNGNAEHLENVARGNEKVLRARLSDADFFYKEDLKLNIDDAVSKLNNIVFHEELGTLGEKVLRVVNLSGKIAEELNFSTEEKENVNRAAAICKFDLVTQMVNEFPELQGNIGEKYAKLSGENDSVSTAINEHYMPRHAEDASPSTNVGAALALADKLDTIAGFFAIDKIPTGSQDPYALRRQASGIVQILLSKKWNISLPVLFELALANYSQFNIEKAKQDLVAFFKLRLKYVLAEHHIRHDLVEAVLESTNQEVNSLIARAEVLEREAENEEFKEVVEALSRVMNIAKSAEKIDIDSALFENESEKLLYNKYLAVKDKVDQLEESTNESEAFKILASLKTEIDTYFDGTMVMSENEAIKQNRLAQMKGLSNLIQTYAKMNSIIVK